MTLDIYPFSIQKNETPFFFDFQKTPVLKISAKLEEILDTSPVMEDLEKIEGTALIYIDFGFNTYLSYQNELIFKNALISLEEIHKKVLLPFKDKIDGVIFYEGSSFTNRIVELSDEDIQELISENLAQQFDKSFVKHIASMNLLASMVHRLAAFIPDDMPAFCKFIDSSELSAIDQAILFSKERFEHVFAVIANPIFQYTTLDLKEGFSMLGSFEKRTMEQELIDFGLLLPCDDKLLMNHYQKLEAKIQALYENGIKFRIIPEKIFNECWNELSCVAYIEGSLSAMTERMIQGFIASGGEVSTL